MQQSNPVFTQAELQALKRKSSILNGVFVLSYIIAFALFVFAVSSMVLGNVKIAAVAFLVMTCFMRLHEVSGNSRNKTDAIISSYGLN